MKLKHFIAVIIFTLAVSFTAVCADWWVDPDVCKPSAPLIDTDSNSVYLASTTPTDEYYYVITIECKQSHFTLDLSEHLKDSMNKLTFEVPVDKDYYNSVRVGQEITESFRMGSLIMKGSIGKWKVTITNKRVVRK